MAVQADPGMIEPVIIGGVFGVLVWLAFVGVIRAAQPPGQLGAAVVVAFGNGLLLALDVSPIGTLAADLVAMSPSLSPADQLFVHWLLWVEAALTLGVGFLVSIGSGRVAGAVLFLSALAAGYFLLIYTGLALLVLAVVIILSAWIFG